MRNLKRVLSLALASIMLLGMMVIGASAADKTAADLTDIDKVTNKEAVNLMVDLGIIEGKPDGSFAPTEGVDRATMAKLICYILMGDTDPALFEGTTTDLKDIDSSWARGYIKYCYANGIITGDGKGSFFPTTSVTVVQAAKMLLVALGYDAVSERYENDSSWSVNIMRDARTAGLLENLSARTNDALTRDDAALMIFNALFGATQTYETQYDQGVAYKTNRTPTGSTLGEETYGLIEVSGTVTGISNGKATLDTIVAKSTSISTVTTTPITNALPATPDMVGSQVTLYVQGTIPSANTLNVRSIYSTSLTVNTSNTLATVYGNSKTGTEALTALLVTASSRVATVDSGKSATANTGDTALTYYYNGQKMADGTDGGSGIDTIGEAQARVGVRGVVVEFKNNNATAGVDTVVITEKRVATLAAAPVVATNSAGDQVVTISTLGLTRADADTVVGYEDLARGDVVLYVNIGGVTYVEKATNVEGVVSGSHSTRGLLVGGTYYLASALTGATSAWAANNYTDTYTFYLDNGGNIVKAEQVTNESTSNYAVLLDTGWFGNSSTLGESNYGQAQLLYADGSTEIVTLRSVDGGTTNVTQENVTTGKADLLGKFYTYTINSSGAYVLKPASGPVSMGSVGISQGRASISYGDSSSMAANANTVFLVKTTNANGDAVYTSYTGIANVPSMTGATAVALRSGSIASYVYISNAGTLTGSTGDYVYIHDANDYYTEPGATSGSYVRVYNAIVNGVETTFRTVNSGVVGDESAAIQSKTMYTVAIRNANDVVSKLNVIAGANTYTGISISGGTMVVDTKSDSGTNKAFTVDSATEFFYIDADGGVRAVDYSGITNDKTDAVYVIDDNGYAETVYVVEKQSTEKAISGISYTVAGGLTQRATINATGTVTVNTGTVGQTVIITGVTTSDGATWSVSGSAVLAANDTEPGASNQIIITVMPENSGDAATYTIGFKAAAS